MVGTVNNNGELTSAQGGPLVDVYAPGVSITVRLSISVPWYSKGAPVARATGFTELCTCKTYIDTEIFQCARGPGNGYTLFSGTSVATPQVAGLAAIFLAAFNVQTAQEVKGLIINQAHSRNGGPDAIYIGNSGDFCRTRQKRDSRWDRRTDAEVSGVDVCQIELSSATTGILATPKSTVSSATPHISVHRSSVAKIPSSTTPDDTPPAKTSSTRAAVHSTSKGHCDDRTWYDTELECDNQCSPRTCTEVNDLYSNEFSAFVCEC